MDRKRDDENADRDGGGQTITESRPKVTRPSMYKVILLNDDYTPMDFVILVLRRFFHKTDPEATAVMLAVHNQGAGLAGVYTYEIAETKVQQVNSFSYQHRHPLKCIMEKED